MKVKEIILSTLVLIIASIGIVGLIDTNIIKEDIVSANISQEDVKLAATAAGTGANTKSVYVVYDFKYGQYTENTSTYGNNVDPDVWTSVEIRNLPQPTWQCHTFQGWYTATSGGSKITKDTKVAILEPQRLFARWVDAHPGTYYQQKTSTHVLRCSSCDEPVKVVSGTITDGFTVSQIEANHTFTTDYNPTCTSQGSKHCTVCGYVASIAALGHDYDSSYTIDEYPTCTESGWKSKHCSRCSSTTGGTSIPENGHSWYESSSETCTDYATDSCYNCSATSRGDKPTGHSYNSTGYCSGCGDQLESECTCCKGNSYTCDCGSSCSGCGKCDDHCTCSSSSGGGCPYGAGGQHDYMDDNNSASYTCTECYEHWCSECDSLLDASLVCPTHGRRN